MKQIGRVILILTLFNTNTSFGQEADKKQIEVARIFLNCLKKGLYEKCWELFDRKNVPEVTQEQFDNVIYQARKDLALFDTFKLTMNGIELIDGKQLDLYTFKAMSKTKNIVDDISVDLLFFPSSELVADIKYKELLKENTASTSSGKETQIDSSFTATIEGVSYKITGINIVHFDNGDGVLAIQVEYKIPYSSNDKEEWGKKEGVKFAKFLVKNGYIGKAKIKADEIGIKLRDELAVSFLDPSIGGGFNVILKPEEFK